MSARVLVAVAVAGLALAASERRRAARLRAIQRERDSWHRVAMRGAQGARTMDDFIRMGAKRA